MVIEQKRVCIVPVVETGRWYILRHTLLECSRYLRSNHFLLSTLPLPCFKNSARWQNPQFLLFVLVWVCFFFGGGFGVICVTRSPRVQCCAPPPPSSLPTTNDGNNALSACCGCGKNSVFSAVAPVSPRMKRHRHQDMQTVFVQPFFCFIFCGPVLLTGGMV